MIEEIMRVEYVDIVDDDHGAARIEVALRTGNSGQSYLRAVDPKLAYRLLCLFNVKRLSEAAGKPIVVLREEPMGLIKGLRSLPCDPWLEILD